MRFSLIISLIIIFAACSLTAEPQQFSVKYYSESVNFDFDNTTLPEDYIRFDEWFAKRFYYKLGESDLNNLVSTIIENQENYNLNGWLTYGLIQKIVDKVAADKSVNYQRLLTWFLLNKTGYDARLAHYRNEYYVQVHTTDDLYEIPFFELDNRVFINITAVEGSKSNRKKSSLEFYLIEFKANPKGESLSFDLSQLPTFSPNIIKKTLRFWGSGQRQEMTVKLDKNIIDLMNDYPIVEEKDYVFRQLSPTLKASLIPQLREKIIGMPQTEAVQFILGLTRSGFRYKEDTDNFGYNRPMIADEVLYYSFSDCEDRSALFFNLVKELLDLPMIIVAYSDHLTIGVKLKENKGKPLYHNGETYTICDPTGPNNTSRVGIYPKGYERKSYEVIGTHE